MARNIRPETQNKVRKTLLDCGSDLFESDQSLRAIFADSRIIAWRDTLPQSKSVTGRVESLYAHLHNQYDRSDNNALHLFIEVLLDRTPEEVACYEQLQKLVESLEVDLVGEKEQDSKEDPPDNKLLFLFTVSVIILLMLLTGIYPKIIEEQLRQKARGEQVKIRAGTFALGTNDENHIMNGLSASAETVSLAEFNIDRLETSIRRYCLCVQTEECILPDELGDEICNQPELADQPMTNVSANGAQTFCRWIGGDLPTYAQWERAARGPKNAPWPWDTGNPEIDRVHMSFPFNDSPLILTNPVPVNSETYRSGDTSYPGETGIRHLVGNVAEWVRTPVLCANNRYTCEEEWEGENIDLYVRGASFREAGDTFDITHAYDLQPSTRENFLGFRCVIQP